MTGMFMMDSVLTKTIASRGWDVCGKTIWSNPKAGQIVFAEIEKDKTALANDPFCVAWKIKFKNKIIADIVGHEWNFTNK